MKYILEDLMYQPNIVSIKLFLEENGIRLGRDDIECRMIFLDYVLTKYKIKIKRRARIRKQLSNQ